MEKPSVAKVSKIMALADPPRLPLATHLISASSHEVTLVKDRFVAQIPQRVISDKAYDSDSLDNKRVEIQDIEMIAPYRTNRTKPKIRDWRSLPRYKRR